MEKPVVFYKEAWIDNLKIGQSAFLSGVMDHPRGLRGHYVQTSQVVRIDGDEIETLNTVYKKSP